MTHVRPQPADRPGSTPAVGQPEQVRELFHRLNNLLGIVLVNAELLEAKSSDDTTRSRAGQVVASVLDALATARTLRQQIEP